MQRKPPLWQLAQHGFSEFECNHVVSNRNGVRFERTSSASGPKVFYKTNEIKLDHSISGTSLFDVAGDNSLKKLKLGGSLTDKQGKNRFVYRVRN